MNGTVALTLSASPSDRYYGPSGQSADYLPPNASSNGMVLPYKLSSLAKDRPSRALQILSSLLMDVLVDSLD